jgi:hypothetical protein
LCVFDTFYLFCSNYFFATYSITRQSGDAKAPSARDVARGLEKENPSWRVSEKKVSKIIKKDKKKASGSVDGTAATDDSSVISTGSTASKARRAFKKVGRSMRSLGSFKKKKSVKEDFTMISPPEPEPVIVPELKPVEEKEEVVAEPEVDLLGGSDVEPDIYDDEENEEKDKACFCVQCTVS